MPARPVLGAGEAWLLGACRETDTEVSSSKTKHDKGPSETGAGSGVRGCWLGREKMHLATVGSATASWKGLGAELGQRGGRQTFFPCGMEMVS